jgi:hypothetical protein
LKFYVLVFVFIIFFISVWIIAIPININWPPKSTHLIIPVMFAHKQNRLIRNNKWHTEFIW